MPHHAVPATIQTDRLTLRGADAVGPFADIVALANNPKMVETTATLPYPYGERDGRDFIAQATTSPELRAYAIASVDDRFMGTILFKFAPGQPPELGYWLGEPHWGQGYAGEAVIGLLAATRHVAGFARISARVLQSNPASIRVLEKAGFLVIERSQGVVERHRGKPLLVMEWRAP